VEKSAENKIIEDLLPQKFGKQGTIWVISLLAVCALGVFAYARQLYYGLEVTALRDYVSWGIYISNFVFFCGH
jgi:Ni/Fe-hydrogenase subunit HybB-like protein